LVHIFCVTADNQNVGIYPIPGHSRT